MFKEWRIKRLSIELDKQKALCELLKVSEQEYGCAYYTNKYHEAFCKMVELQ